MAVAHRRQVPFQARPLALDLPLPPILAPPLARDPYLAPFPALNLAPDPFLPLLHLAVSVQEAEAEVPLLKGKKGMCQYNFGFKSEG